MIESIQTEASKCNKLLGHRDLNTTEIYTHIELQDLKNTIESAATNSLQHQRYNAAWVQAGFFFAADVGLSRSWRLPVLRQHALVHRAAWAVVTPS